MRGRGPRLGAGGPLTTIRPKPASPRPVTPARPRPRGAGPGSLGRPGRGCREEAAPPTSERPGLPCLASLWPRRSGPRPRRSPADCGSWSSQLKDASRYRFGCSSTETPAALRSPGSVTSLGLLLAHGARADADFCASAPSCDVIPGRPTGKGWEKGWKPKRLCRESTLGWPGLCGLM